MKKVIRRLIDAVVSWVLLVLLYVLGMGISGFILALAILSLLSSTCCLPWDTVMPSSIGTGIGCGISAILAGTLLHHEGLRANDFFS